ncbi:MAG: hypothetical protein HY332_23365 [Chloroflexi bacterium]|nr:hypothetical protein [Chloroflexota bacterium]
MRRPIWVGVLRLEPGGDFVEISASRLQRQAVANVDTAVAQREQLAPQKVDAAQGAERDGAAREGDERALSPAFWSVAFGISIADTTLASCE